jgi:hypothetical protein
MHVLDVVLIAEVHQGIAGPPESFGLRVNKLSQSKQPPK